MKNPTHSLTYISSLDGVRAIAVIAVLFSHIMAKQQWTQHVGIYGVGIFFVMSGFLISRILLNEKDKMETGQITFKQALKKFYVRRSLRILPIYYLLIIALYFFNTLITIDVKGSIVYYLTYTSNILLVITQNWTGMLSHTWSLATEEQFYLIWPFVIFLCPSKYLIRTIYFVIFLGTLYSVLGHLLFPDVRFLDFQVIACMPSFAIGSLVGYYYRKNYTYPPALILFCKLFSIAFPLSILIIGHYIKSDLLELFGQLFYGIPASLFLVYVTDPNNDFFKTMVLQSTIMVHLGKISYGIYLYHLPVYFLWPFLNHRVYNILSVTNGTAQYVLDVIFCFAFSYIIALLSWYAIEKPMNNLKRHF